VVMSVAFSCGRAIFCSPRSELSLDTLSTSPPIESRTVLFQELVCSPCAAASPDQTERDSPKESSPTAAAGPLFFLRLFVRWLWLVQRLVSETVSSHCHRSLPTFGAARLQCSSPLVRLDLILAALTDNFIAYSRALFRRRLASRERMPRR
jgi:hypothetical protein